jgi:hypothetical protein
MDTGRILWQPDRTEGKVAEHRGLLPMVGDTWSSPGTQCGRFRALKCMRREGQILLSLHHTVDNLETAYEGQVLASEVKERCEQEGS